MREIFHGWRRKIGLLTLVLALAFTAAWGRSLIAVNRLSFKTGTYNFNRLTSINGNVLCLRVFSADPAKMSATHEHAPELFHEFADGFADWFLTEISHDLFGGNRRTLLGIETGEYSEQNWLGKVQVSILKISYWSIIIPLTLCSACLLLLPLCRSTQKKDDESVVDVAST